ncbi:hypothetical protein [Dyella humicola]|uniref:hypothetical protein n=1 Tax=Dyella humicola TaxID=2992126 RepID=UPI002251D0F5|nr:hypothetical protein [Dyella humicola]
MIVMTHLGIRVRRALDGSQNVFVPSIRSGPPLNVIIVAGFPVNGQTRHTNATSATCNRLDSTRSKSR